MVITSIMMYYTISISTQVCWQLYPLSTDTKYCPFQGIVDEISGILITNTNVQKTGRMIFPIYKTKNIITQKVYGLET